MPDASTPLERVVRGEVDVTSAARRAAGADASHLSGTPRAVVRPADTDDVVALVQWARAEVVPLVPRGGGTSLDGESVPTDGAVVVDLSGWNAVEEISEDERSARVGPGLVNRALQEAAGRSGLFFPPNPGSWRRSTIGGNLATNASGPRSFRYGSTRAWVRSLEVVLGRGSRVHLGTRAAKRSIGPDLLSLVVGSEGTLGVVTEVTVKLAPVPPVRRGLVVPIADGIALGALAGRLARTPAGGLSAVEFVDRSSAEALAEFGRPIGPAGEDWLLLEIEADDDAGAGRRLAAVTAALAAAGVRAPPETYDDADDLWSRRGESGDALDRRWGVRIREDIAVPLPHVDDLIARLRRIASEARVPMFLYGHLGEGSLHPNFGIDPSTPAAERIRGQVFAAALALGGTISAEHGIGALKRPYVERELGPDVVDWLWSVKRWCDPDGVLNPGKLYPPGRSDERSSRSPSEVEAG